MTELALPEVRWGTPQYRAAEFVVQEADPLDNAAAAFNGLASVLSELSSDLQSLLLPGWTGAAADTYRLYLSTLSTAMTDLGAGMTNAAIAVNRGADTIESYLRPIGLDAASICNDAQTEHARENAAATADLLPTDFSLAESLMAEGMTRGAECQQGVDQSLSEIAASLSDIDGSYSYLTIPMPVVGSSTVVSTIFAPVLGSDTATGQTAAAEQAIHNLTETTTFTSAADLKTELEKLTPAEREWVLDHVPSWLLTAYFLETPHPEDILPEYEWFAQNLRADDLALIAAADPYHYFRPGTFDGGPQNVFWVGLSGPVHPSGAVDVLVQGTLGDCHLLASLAAIAITPGGQEFFDKHIKQNSNGTYTVTLYDGAGKPFPVTVLPEVATSQTAFGGDETAYARSKEGLNAYQIYEKAVAQASAMGLIDLNAEPGGFGDLHFGFPANDLPVITGVPAEALSPKDVSAQDLSQQLTSGALITVTTFNAANSMPSTSFVNNQAPAASHVYYVTAVDDSACPPTVTLGNPWGPGQSITLTITELQNWTQTVTVGQTP